MSIYEMCQKSEEFKAGYLAAVQEALNRLNNMRSKEFYKIVVTTICSDEKGE